MAQDMAFLPVEVVLISFILEKYLNRREQQEKFRKMQVVISAFYSDVGSQLIQNFSRFNTNYEILKEEFSFEQDLIHHEKERILNLVCDFDYAIDSRAGDLLNLKNFLITTKPNILRMFENPNLMEHDNFTDMLWSVYHVLDELENRNSFTELPANDMNHLSLDIKRAYQLVIKEWVEYMIHVKKEYPYLYSLAIRKNPFSDNEIIFK
ncbi:hypothetical protein JCM17380_42110 [Desulfosporosinus burensis]